MQLRYLIGLNETKKSSRMLVIHGNRQLSPLKWHGFHSFCGIETCVGVSSHASSIAVALQFCRRYIAKIFPIWLSNQSIFAVFFFECFYIGLFWYAKHLSICFVRNTLKPLEYVQFFIDINVRTFLYLVEIFFKIPFIPLFKKTKNNFNLFSYTIKCYSNFQIFKALFQHDFISS